EPLVEVLKTLLEVIVVSWIKFAQLLRKAAGQSPPIVGIEPVMWIPQWMHVAHGARDHTSRLFQDLGEFRCVQITRCAHLNTRIATLRNQWRQPADLQL